MIQIPTKQLKSGFSLPVLGLGTWLIGGNKIRTPQNDDSKDIRDIEHTIEKGITHIDTAENYAEGHCEELIGSAIKNFKRKDLFLVSKVDKRNLRYQDLIKSANSSLKRLGISYFNLYLIHSYNPDIPLKESIKAMDFLVARGLTKYIGVSNFNTAHLKDAQNYSSNKICVNQVYYNLQNREPEEEGLLRYCQENDIILTAFRPLDKGKILSSDYLSTFCQKYQKTPAQIALNYMISQKNVAVISKMTNIKVISKFLMAH